MGTRVTDSALYAQLWGTAELGEVFEERSRIRSWVQILVALAEAQAGLRIIPDTAARDLAAAAARESLDLDLDLAARETRRTGHSTLGVIAALGRVLPQGMVAEHERALDSPPILVKRDDLTGFALARNKARKLEFLLGDALAGGCDVLVTGDGPGSNHCQATAAAARVAGMSCHLVMYGTERATVHPNLALARRLDVTARSLPWRVIGASVSRPLAECRERVLRLARECAELLGWPLAVPAQVELRDARGPGTVRPRRRAPGRRGWLPSPTGCCLTPSIPPRRSPRRGSPTPRLPPA